MSSHQRTSFARGTRGFYFDRSVLTVTRVISFRVYGSDHSARDYELLHADLEVEIVEEEATFYDAEDGHEPRLDHSRRTLGHDA